MSLSKEQKLAKRNYLKPRPDLEDVVEVLKVDRLGMDCMPGRCDLKVRTNTNAVGWLEEVDDPHVCELVDRCNRGWRNVDCDQERVISIERCARIYYQNQLRMMKK